MLSSRPWGGCENAHRFGHEKQAASLSIGERTANLAQPALPPYIEQMSEAKGITLTPKAVEMAKQKVADADAPAEGLRLGVKGGGCSGYYYVYEFAKKIRPNKDLVFDFDGLKVVVDNRSIEFLQGAVLDWEQSLMSYGFKWKNPNATGDCGCGESFEVS